MRGVEILLGGLLVTGGIIATPAGDLVVVDTAEVSFGLAGWFDEWDYSGSGSVTSNEAGLRAEGNVEATVSGDLTVEDWTCDRYRTHAEIDTPIVIYDVAYNQGLSCRVKESFHANATMSVDSRDAGLLFVHPSGHGTSGFRLDFAPVQDAHVMPSRYTSGWGDEAGFRTSYLLEAPLWALSNTDHEVSSHDMVKLPFERFHAEGGLVAVLQNSTVASVEDANGDHVYESWNRQRSKLGGHPAGFDATELRYVVVKGRQLAVTLDFEKVAGHFVTRSADWALAGNLSMTVQEGELDTANGSHSLKKNRVQVEGNVTMETRLEGLGDTVQRIGPVTTPSSPAIDRPEIHARLEGEPTVVAVDGKPIYVQDRAETTLVPTDVGWVPKILGALLVGWGVVRTALFVIWGMVADNPLENRRRRAIYDHLLTHGLTYISDLHRATGIPLGSLAYHLAILKQGKVVTSVHRSGYTVYFLPCKEFCREDYRRLALLAEPIRRDICRAILACGPLSQAHLIDRLDVVQSTVSRQLAVLRDAGLVERSAARNARYDLTALTQRWYAYPTRRARQGEESAAGKPCGPLDAPAD